MSKTVVVVGGGNAGLCAAIAARENGAEVLCLERGDGELRGGNTSFTAGAMRVAYDGVEDLLTLMPELTGEEMAKTDFGTYPGSEFFDDLARVTDYRTDPELAEILVDESLPTMQWMREHGVRFAPIYGRQAFLVDGRFRFWGGLTVEVNGGGPGLVDALTKAAEKLGIAIEYGARVTGLVHGDEGVTGVTVRQGGTTRTVTADAVVLASGGFQANPAWRAQYLGPNWDLAKVRGTQFNTGDGHRIAMDIGASPAGNWSGCHSVGWERNAPEFGDIRVGDSFQKHSYPFGIMVNAEGRRFVDEGADFRNYTYAKYGSRILAQPGQFAWQVFDQQVTHLLRDEYRIKEVTKVTGRTLEELAGRLEGVDAVAFLAEVSAYNDAVDTATPFDPNVKDGRGTTGLAISKTNWANRLEEGPFEAYQVTCGVTFTFGGLRIDVDARVLDTDQQPIPGLFAAGEIVGGIFYLNYPGGSGLTNGAVFGRRAGVGAAS